MVENVGNTSRLRRAVHVDNRPVSRFTRLRHVPPKYRRAQASRQHQGRSVLANKAPPHTLSGRAVQMLWREAPNAEGNATP